jgi:hypothetical protein
MIHLNFFISISFHSFIASSHQIKFFKKYKILHNTKYKEILTLLKIVCHGNLQYISIYLPFSFSFTISTFFFLSYHLYPFLSLLPSTLFFLLPSLPFSFSSHLYPFLSLLPSLPFSISLTISTLFFLSYHLLYQYISTLFFLSYHLFSSYVDQRHKPKGVQHILDVLQNLTLKVKN